ncbi:hypothetical protein H2248_011660 [Termitomyces sp. 'cryptogamus']|nr:hypothetical protein H2248_011660 [Termitomyces sp. 'cryptogamus']
MMNGNDFALYEPSAPVHRQPATLAASIWAPQPQPSETTWPKTLDSFSRVAEQHDPVSTNIVYDPNSAPVRREDVFGPVPSQVRAPKEPFGAIGDGRKKSPSEFNDDTHVEQLLRTLNLNSPIPSKKPSLSLNLDASPSSPDFSPASVTSSLMTPTDLSPSQRSFDPTATANTGKSVPYNIGLGPTAFIQQPSLLFEHSSPAGHTQALESYISQPHMNLFSGNGSGIGQGPVYRSIQPVPAGYAPAQAQAHSSGGLPFFEPFAETPAPGLYSAQPQPSQALIRGQTSPGSQQSTQSHPQSLPQLPTPPTQTQPASGLAQPPGLVPRGLFNPSSPASSRTRLPMDWRLHPQSQSHGGGEWGMGLGLGLGIGGGREDKFDVYGLGQGLGQGMGGGHGHQHHTEDMLSLPGTLRAFGHAHQQSGGGGQGGHGHGGGHHVHSGSQHSHEPINFLSLLHPSSSPPYPIFVERIIKSSDQQASIFLQQKLKVADGEERAKIVDAICARGFEMMAHRFGNWAVQRCLEAAAAPEERRKLVGCMRGRVVELATNCYGCHVLQKALDCEEDIRLLIVSELLLGDPAQTLVNKHASHVWSKIMELSWTPPAPPIFAYVNKSLKGKWASLACHETGSLVVQHAFENLEPEAKDGIVDELINNGPTVFAEVVRNQWGSYCIQHILEHGSDKHRAQTLQHLLDGLLDFATSEQGAKSVTKALKEGGKATLDRIVERMCEAANGSRRAMIVDLALSVTGSQLIASVLPTVRPSSQPRFSCASGADVPTLAVHKGGQGPAGAAVRLYPGSYCHTPWVQDRVEGYLVV